MDTKILTDTLSGDGVINLISSASIVVQLVMLILVVMSIVSWAIIFSKWIIIRSDERETKKFLQIYRASNSYSKLHSSIKGMDGSITELFRDSYGEIVKFKKARVISSREKQDGENGSTIPEIDIVGLVERELKRSMSTQISKLESSLIFLATTGTTAPFIGLFGTVWGIMTSFMSLAGGEECLHCN